MSSWLRGPRQQDGAPRQDFRPDGQGALIDVEAGPVVEVPGPVRGRDAEPEQAAGRLGEVAGEVLASHAGQGDQIDVVGADDLAGRANADGGDFGNIDPRADTVQEGDVDRGPAG